MSAAAVQALNSVWQETDETLNVVQPGKVAAPEYPYQICSNEYGLYSFPKAFQTRAVYRTLSQGEVYEPRTLKLLQNMARDGDIVSGGAFVGDFLPALSRALIPGALVHSFDPNPTAFQSALHTVSLNALNNVCLSNVAVGEEDGVLPLMVAKKSGQSLEGSARITSQPQEGQTVDVQVVRLDDLVPSDRKISVLHLDIEGQELPALLGAEALLRRNRPFIALEAPKPRTRQKILRFFRNRFPELGYRMAGAFENNIFLVAT